MIHLDLFSGIGGFAYAVDQVFDDVEHIFCEIDPFCQQVLKKHWKGSVIYGDIRELTADTDRNGLQEPGAKIKTSGDRQFSETIANTTNPGIERPRERENKVFLLTGGFPCQPFSQAGKRKGTNDDRHLWPAMFRVIQLTKPTWIIAENVRGLLTINGGLVFEQVCLDLEREGYEVQPFIIPAVAVNAPHRRDRVWFVANKLCERLSRVGYEENGVHRRKLEKDGQEGCEVGSINAGCSSNAPDTGNERLERRSNEGERLSGLKDRNGSDQRRDWDKNWLEVATELCGVDDGLPAELDEFKLTKAKHRVERLKSLGNSIVPQVVVQILKAIKDPL